MEARIKSPVAALSVMNDLPALGGVERASVRSRLLRCERSVIRWDSFFNFLVEIKEVMPASVSLVDSRSLQLPVQSNLLMDHSQEAIIREFLKRRQDLSH
jgi:hypothetical protein